MAKEQGRLVRDGDLMTACAQVCPSDAITFGNLKDRGSKVSLERADARSYLALGGDPDKREFGIKTLPNVSYMAVVAHREPLGTGADGHGAGHGEGHGAGHGEGQAAGHGDAHDPKAVAPEAVAPTGVAPAESPAPAHQ